MDDVSDIFASAIADQPAAYAPPEQDVVWVRGGSRPQLAFGAGSSYQPDPQAVDDVLRMRFGTTPFRHQARGVVELTDNPHWCLAWDMGTGKTATVCYRIAIGLANFEFRGPILVIAPLAVVNVWRHEMKLHAGLESVLLIGDKKQRQATLAEIDDSSIVVTSYEQARIETPALFKRKFDVVVCDEIHRIKNTSTQASRRIRKIAKFARYRWGLSGTPAPNSPLDIFGTLTFLNPKVLGTESKQVFEQRHAVYGPEVARGVRKIIGYRDLGKLEASVAEVCSRVLKEHCLDLPAKTFVTIPVTLSKKALRVYRDLKEEAVADLKSQYGEGRLTVQNVLSASLRLLQVAGGFVPDDDGTVHPLKPNAKLDVLADLVEDAGDEPFVIWTAFRAENEAVCRSLGRDNCVAYHGGLSDHQRKDAIERFRGGGARFFVSTSAGREGLTLVEACNSIFFSRTYHLLNWLQAIDRVHRIGQTRKVTIYSLIAQGTTDESVARALDAKQELQDLVLRSSMSQIEALL